MTDIFLTISIIVVVALLVAIFVFLAKKLNTSQDQSAQIKDLERRITDLMISQMKDVRAENTDTTRQMADRIQSFTKATTELCESVKDVQTKVGDLNSFQEIFRSQKLRGEWGEAQLSYILTQNFPAELIEEQHVFLSGEKVDCVLKLPDGKLLPIDSKLSYENFEKMVNAKLETEKAGYRKMFLGDIKKMVDGISSKYILPGENTVDLALMYIPAEAIYYELMFNMADESVLEYAWKKKIVICSPNTLLLSLRTILHWIKDTQISKQTNDILKKLERIIQDSQVLDKSFKNLGTHLKNAQSSYDDSQKRLELFTDRTQKIIEMGADYSQKILENKEEN